MDAQTTSLTWDAPADGCEHTWVMSEDGYTRSWSTAINDESKTIRATYGGSEDFSENGTGEEYLACSTCLARKPLPDGYEIVWD